MSLSHVQDKATDWAPTPISTSFGSEEIGWQALGPAIACTVLATAVVTLRWYTHCRLARCLGVDDVVILLSIVSTNSNHTRGVCQTDRFLRYSRGVCAPSLVQN